MSPDEFSQLLHEGLLAALWKQWSSLGVAGSSEGVHDDLILDPEVLLLATFVVGRRDPRLFDEVLDWLTINGDLINVPRLRRMIDKRGLASVDRVFRAVSEVLTSRKSMAAKWSIRGAEQARPQPGLREEVFFVDLQGVPLPMPREPDPLFRRAGFLREQIRFRGLSRSFPRAGAASMLLRLRALIGNSSRCELLCLLATRPRLTGNQATELTDYAPRTIQIALSEMSRSGYVDSERIGNEIHYTLSPVSLDIGLHEAPRFFPPSSQLVEALLKLAHATQVASEKSSSTPALVTMVRSESRIIAKNLARAGYVGALSRSITARPEDFFSTLWIDCEHLIERWMARQPAFPSAG